MAKHVFKLPDVGEGVVEGEIVKWNVKPGDTVKEDEPLVELMTDKATVAVINPFLYQSVAFMVSSYSLRLVNIFSLSPFNEFIRNDCFNG